jgi:hypothetical protein
LVWTVLAPSQASSEVSMCTLSQINMESYDDDLKNFEAHGAAPRGCPSLHTCP